MEIESLVKDCTNSSLASSNVFYQRDDPEHGKADKKAFLQFMVRLAITPVWGLPHWDPSKKALVDPTWWEQLWHATHKVFGAVGDMQEKALAQQRKGAAACQNHQGPGQQNGPDQ